MKITEIQNKKVEVSTDIICDSCGKSCKVYENVVDNEKRVDFGEKFYDFEYMELKATWGYNSGKDLQQWTAHLCEKCVDEKLSFLKFKITSY